MKVDVVFDQWKCCYFNFYFLGYNWDREETWSDITPAHKLDSEFLGDQSKNQIMITYAVPVFWPKEMYHFIWRDKFLSGTKF